MRAGQYVDRLDARAMKAKVVAIPATAKLACFATKVCVSAVPMEL
jgi:hypothetical protein